LIVDVILSLSEGSAFDCVKLSHYHCAFIDGIHPGGIPAKPGLSSFAVLSIKTPPAIIIVKNLSSAE
jgi:hypothetical protein